MNAPAVEYGLLAFSSLIAMVNPIGAAPLFVEFTRHEVAARRRTAWRASLTVAVAMGVVAVAGSSIFRFFGVTVPAFQVAGGLILLIMALQTYFATEVEGAGGPVRGDVAVVPLGIPILCGAGSFSAVTVLAGLARQPDQQLALSAAIVAVALSVLLVLLAAPWVVARMGPSGQAILGKVMSLLTAVIGVQFILNGLTSVILDVARRLP